MTPLQNKILNILVDVDRVCRKLGLTYYLAYGTQLGAIRHKGFIPWDDDVDIIMPRADYEKFLAVANDHLENKYKVIDWKNKKDYAYNFAKVEDTTTSFIEEFTIKSLTIFGVYIDIFPMDNALETKEKTKELWMKQRRLQNIIYTHYTKIVESNNFIYGALKHLLTKVNVSFLHKKLDKMITKYNGTTNKYFVYTNTFDYVEYDENDLETIEVEFEGHKFFTNKTYDKILKDNYGNYMELPKEEDRIVHNAFYCNLDKQLTKNELKELLKDKK